MGIENSTFHFFVHDLCGIEVHIGILRSKFRISVEGASWTKMEYRILVPIQTLPAFSLFLNL